MGCGGGGEGGRKGRRGGEGRGKEGGRRGGRGVMAGGSALSDTARAANGQRRPPIAAPSRSLPPPSFRAPEVEKVGARLPPGGEREIGRGANWRIIYEGKEGQTSAP